MILLAFAALLLPGLAWWAWLGNRGDPLVSIAQIWGVGLASIILLTQAGFLLNIRFSRIEILALLALFALLSLLGFIKKGVRLERRYWLGLWVGLVLLGLASAWRLYQARDLLLPNWVDSQHHFLIVRAILDQGGLPNDLAPYLEMPFYYHYGFHAVAGLFTAVSGLPIGAAMLVLGQVLNTAVGLSVYSLGKTVWCNWRPALAAVLLVSFATRMPAYYLSWGRYTLITGLIFLPLAMGLVISIPREKRHWGNALALALMTGGILLSHYFAALLFGVFVGLSIIVSLVTHRRQLPLTLMRSAWVLNSLAFGFLLATPWLWRVARYSLGSPGVETSLPESLEAILTTGAGDYIWMLLGPTSNHWLLLPAGIGLIITLLTRQNTGFGLWSLAIAVLSLPWGLSLRPFRADHFAIVLFLPLVLLAGWFFWLVARWVGARLNRPWVTMLLLLLIVAGWTAWGFPQMRDILNPATVLVTQADLTALDWIAENTPADSRFFINTAYWMEDIHRGVDGGGWILPYTGRWSLVPTVFYGFSPDLRWTSELQEWGRAASQMSTCSDDFWALVEEAELDWIYIREGVGSLGVSGLAGCEWIELAFTNDSVRVFRIDHE